MAKIGELARKRYNEFIKEYKGASAAILDEERRAAPDLRKGDLGQTPVRVMLCSRNLDLVAYYTVMNSLSWALLNVKNENILNEARKRCYQAIIYLEDVVSNCIDCSFSDYEAGVAAIDAVLGDKEKHDLVRKLGYSIDTVRDGFGANTKWKWSFVEIEARFAVVVKNLINFKNLLSKLDPSYKNYDAVLEHVALAQRRLAVSADAYREKYELVDAGGTTICSSRSASSRPCAGCTSCSARATRPKSSSARSTSGGQAEHRPQGQARAAGCPRQRGRGRT